MVWRGFFVVLILLMHGGFVIVYCVTENMHAMQGPCLHGLKLNNGTTKVVSETRKTQAICLPSN